MRSICPVTEYTSLTPSMAAISSATSGIRATSAFTNTMAVIMSPTLADRLVHRPDRTTLVEGHQRRPGLLDRVMDLEVLLGASEGTAPLALHVHQADAVGLQPAQDLLRLLGRGRRGGARAGDHGVGTRPQAQDPVPGVCSRRDHPGCGQPTVPDDVDGPTVVLATGGDELGTPGQRPQPLGAGRATQERAQPVTPGDGVLEPAGGRQQLH